jgi:hypothetical protein
MVQDVRRWLVDDFLSRKITRNIPNLKTKKEETIMRKSKMTILSCIAIFLIAALILVPATQAGEKTYKLKSRVVNSLTKMEFMAAGDVKGHILGIYENRGIAFSDNGEIATTLCHGMFESLKGVVSYHGYSVHTFEDGSTQWKKYKGTAEPDPGGKVKLYKATFEVFKGTGRFEGIKGSGSFSGTKPLWDKESKYKYLDSTGSYTLPSN